jgi:antitoxin (DNA-binding transcriptional repressor) of toxin-antitoxin stability system
MKEAIMQVAVRQAKNILSKLGNKAHAGERIVVTRNGHPWFDLVPHARESRRTAPLRHVTPTISLKDAIAPVSEKDIPGWR